jgi:hypothetical protein
MNKRYLVKLILVIVILLIFLYKKGDYTFIHRTYLISFSKKSSIKLKLQFHKIDYLDNGNIETPKSFELLMFYEGKMDDICDIDYKYIILTNSHTKERQKILLSKENILCKKYSATFLEVKRLFLEGTDYEGSIFYETIDLSGSVKKKNIFFKLKRKIWIEKRNYILDTLRH